MYMYDAYMNTVHGNTLTNILYNVYGKCMEYTYSSYVAIDTVAT